MSHSTRRKTFEEVKAAVESAEDSVGGHYRLASTTYVNNKLPLSLEHHIDGEIHRFEMNAHMFISRGDRCPHCRGERISIAQRGSLDDFKKKVADLVGDEYIVTSQTYRSNKTKLTMQHVACGRTFSMRPNDFLTKDRCPHCKADATGNRLRYTPIKVRGLFDALNATGYELIDASGYQNGLSKLLFRHTDCGHTFRMAWNYFQSGCRCPWCAKNSPGEIAILRFLEANGVEYEPEYWFEDLRVQRPLRFDFKVTLRDGRIGLVEYDGFYHYGKGLFGHTGQDTQKRDKMKDEYCQVNGIPLLRIGWEDYDDISRQLEHFLATGSTTIPSWSTPQAIGGGNGKHL